MKNIPICISMCLLLLVGCNNQNKSTTTDKADQNKSKSTELVDAFPKFSNTTTSNQIRETCDSIILKIDTALSELKKIEKEATIYGIPNTPVTIWYSDSNTPVKIEHSVANDSGKFTDKFQYYFIKGQLWYSDQIFAKYVFENDNLKYWLDENWRINEIPQNNFKEREKAIKNNISKLLNE